ncbi:MAG: long-chain fatty acid--CoA ligase, partial [Myxococcales bacterium]|nr:long-chain fatty acid--CoA ligase [Myxococcales bacterium]
MLTTGPNLPVVHLSREAKTVGDMFRKRARASADYPAFHTKRDGAWVATSWREFFEQASAVARGLVALGLEPGDRVGILGPTLAPWAIQDMAAQLAGLVSFGIYPMQSPDQIRYLLAHSDARVVFVANSEELEHVLEAAEGLEHLVAIVPWEHALYEQYADRDPRLRSIHDFEGAPLDDATLEARLRARKPEDLAVLVYTSGTTGPPKGAMISHRNILELLASEDTLELRQNDLSLNFLPMAHVAERLLGFYGRIDVGLTTAYASSISAVLPELLEVRPTLFGSVPRIFEKAYGKIHSEIERKPAAVQRLFRWAKAVGIERVRRRLANQSVPLRLELQHRVADRLVFRKIRGVFGGRVRIFITGAAPTALEILEFFWAAGMPIYEVYGMTEATVMTHCNREGAVRLGTVGRPMREIECRLADDGEILIRGPWVFVGYFKDESATSRTVVDGWLHTGDIGEIDGDGYLKITDRKKHLIITAGGK